MDIKKQNNISSSLTHSLIFTEAKSYNTGQKILFAAVQQLFPKHNQIHYNARKIAGTDIHSCTQTPIHTCKLLHAHKLILKHIHAGMKKEGGSYHELDVWLPKLNIGFEYQVFA